MADIKQRLEVMVLLIAVLGFLGYSFPKFATHNDLIKMKCDQKRQLIEIYESRKQELRSIDNTNVKNTVMKDSHHIYASYVTQELISLGSKVENIRDQMLSLECIKLN